MAQAKTQPTDASVEQVLAAVPDPGRRADATVVDAMMREVTGEPAVVWGTAIVGYGAIAYPGSRGKQATWPVVAFALRKTELVLYLNTEIEAALFDELARTGAASGACTSSDWRTSTPSSCVVSSSAASSWPAGDGVGVATA